MKKLYYIGLKDGRTCEGIVRAESIEAAKRELARRGVEEVNVAILRSEPDFLDIESNPEQVENT